MLGNIKPNKKEINTKQEIKKTQTNVDSVVKPTVINVTEPILDSYIPEWLPEKDNVAIVSPLKILPHLRSKVKFTVHFMFHIFNSYLKFNLILIRNR